MREPKPLPRTQEWKVCCQPHLKHDLAQCGIRARWHGTRLKAFARREEEKCPTHSLAVPWGQLASALSPPHFHWCTLGQGWSHCIGVHRRDWFLIKNSRIFFILPCIYIFTFTVVFPGTASSVCICRLWNICIAFPLVNYVKPAMVPIPIQTSLLPVSCGILQAFSCKRKTERRYDMIGSLHETALIGNVNSVLWISSSEPYWYYLSRLGMLEMSLETHLNRFYSALFCFWSPWAVYLGKTKCHAKSHSASSKKSHHCA